MMVFMDQNCQTHWFASSATLGALHYQEGSAMTSPASLTHSAVFPLITHLIIIGDVDGLISRHAEHTCFPYRGELLGPHQAEKGPFCYIYHDALAASLWRGRWVEGRTSN